MQKGKHPQGQRSSRSHLGQLGFNELFCLRSVLGYVASVGCGVIAIAAVWIASVAVRLDLAS
jgi:hypothetical protein